MKAYLPNDGCHIYFVIGSYMEWPKYHILRAGEIERRIEDWRWVPSWLNAQRIVDYIIVPR